MPDAKGQLAVLRWSHFIGVAVVAICTCLYAFEWVEQSSRSSNGLTIAAMVTSVLAGAIIAVYRPRGFPPLWSMITQVLNAFIVLVLGFGHAYWSYSPQAHSCMNVSLTKLDSIYFTLTTLTTVGYGDIIPVTERCRAIVSVQMVAGLALIAVTLTVMVSRIFKQ